MANDIDIEQVHRYLDGAMEAGEQEAYEQAMGQDEALRGAVAREKQLREAMAAAFDERAREEIGQVHRQLQGEGFFDDNRSGSMRRMVVRVAAVAVVVILMCVGLWWFAVQPEAFDSQAAFQRHFGPETTKIENMIANLTSVGFTPERSRTDSLQEALVLYREEHYPEAAEALEFYLQAHPQSDTARFYLALAELSRSQYKAAAARLSTLAQKEGFYLQREAQWYLALCCLQLEGRLEEARRLFGQLAQAEGFDKREAAHELFSALE